MSALFFNLLITSLLSFFITMIVGVSLGIIAFFIFISDLTVDLGTIDPNSIFWTFFAAIVIGATFSYQKIQLQQQKINSTKMAAEAHSKIDEQVKRAVMVLAGSIAHDLRTPLATLSMITARLKKYLPVLLSSTPATPDASDQTMIEDFRQMPGDIDELIQNMNLYIDHNLKALKHCQENSIDEKSLVLCKSYRGINNALNSYPFAPGEQELIKTDTMYSFDFLGNPILFLRILFNLINNSLYQIHKNQKGQIFINCDQQPDYNIIRVRDTAGGAPASIVEHIFDGYVTTKENGTGVGLAFCKLTMENFGGTIECHSEEGDFIEFTLKFPKIVP